MSQKTEIVLSVISHTNIGKTTLARTLLKKDIGEVRDEAHVTLEAESHVLIETGEEALILWDTPGFGYVGNILKRLKQEGGAIGWIMHEVVDRVFNRSLYSSLAAARNVRANADAVLYLVNVREDPRDAGYVGNELALLTALEKPVFMILNQVGEDRMKELPALKKSWRETFADHACLKEVLLLDAFCRTWYQELSLIDKIANYLPPDKQKALAKLRSRFVQGQDAIFADCMRQASKAFWFAAHQSGRMPEDDSPKQLFKRMVRDLQTQLDLYLELLVDRHGIEAEGRADLKADIQQVTGLVGKPIPETKSGVLAGAVTSAGTGLMADLLSGGLTFGGGALLGFLGGYLGGFSYAKVLNFRNRQGKVAWKRDALAHLFQLLLSYYLLAALHGRGKGKLVLDSPAPFLAAAIEKHLPRWASEVDDLVNITVIAASPEPGNDFYRKFDRVFKACAQGILAELYPDRLAEETGSTGRN